MVSMGHNKGEIKTLSSDGRSVNAGENMRLGFLTKRHKKGRKRPKYQNPWNEHPETARPIAETAIHANHAEAFFSSLRRTCATFRRETNMYAKATTGLQRLLRVYWVMHNFLRVHLTIREVPAVALGILERRLSVHEIFQIQMA